MTSLLSHKRGLEEAGGFVDDSEGEAEENQSLISKPSFSNQKFNGDYEKLSNLQVAMVQNEAADMLLNMQALVHVTQELFGVVSNSGYDLQEAEGGCVPGMSGGEENKSRFFSRSFSKFKNMLVPKKFNFGQTSTPEKKYYSPVATAVSSPKFTESEKFKVFETNLDSLPTIKFGNSTLPIIYKELMEGIKAKGLGSEGIFRVNGNFKKVKQLREMLDAGEGIHTMDVNVYEYADLFKLFLRSLPEAVIPDNLTLLYIGCAQLLDKLSDQDHDTPDLVIKVLQLFHLVMPTINRHVMQSLFSFFAEIADKSEKNKMDPLNIAKVMVPNLCRYEKEAPQEPEVLVGLHRKMAHLVRFCIDNHSAIFNLPEEISKKYLPEDPTAKKAQTQLKLTPDEVPREEGEEQEPQEKSKENKENYKSNFIKQVSPLKHKKIAELLEGSSTPKKRMKMDSPVKGSPSSLGNFSPASPKRLKKKFHQKSKDDENNPGPFVLGV